MGLFKKFKNIFVEEYEEDEEEVVQMPSSFESRIPTKAETKEKEIVKPIIKEEKKVEVKPVESKPMVNETVPVHVEEEKIKIEPVQQKKEDKFVFPVYFDDSDFAAIDNKKEEKVKPKIEPKKPEIKKDNNENKKESSYKEAYNNKRTTLTEDKKVFKPTPIISPVYGILDKNYYKEDIVVTPITKQYSSSSGKNMTIDEVRKKAFGTLEDDLTSSIIDTDEQQNVSDDEPIFGADDFEAAIEEDKKRDIAKDGLKSDIESLLNNDEFVNAINLRKTKIEKEDEEEKTITTKKGKKTDKNKKVEKETSNEEELEDTNSLVDDIMALAESGSEEVEENMNNEEEIGNDNEEESIKNNEYEEDELPITDSDEIELPVNITDTEIENAYDDVTDLNESDLFNIIDSMYDKEDK